jgi:hypothetical protein
MARRGHGNIPPGESNLDTVSRPCTATCLGVQMTRTARVFAVLASAALVVATPVAAHAGKPVENAAHYSGTDSFDEPDFCGIPVHFEVEFSGVAKILPVKGSDGQAFFGFDNYEFTEIISTEDGWIRTHGNGAFHEQKATHIAGNIWEFQFIDAGTFRVYDSEGNLLLRANGVFKASEQFDTLGDSQPGGEPVPDTFEVLADNGPSFTDDEFCAAVLPELT